MATESSVSGGHSLEDEIDLCELLVILWGGKFWVVGVTLVAMVISVVVALLQPNIYRSDALLAVETEGGGLSSLAGSYGGLASLAGISLQDAGVGEKAIGIETLKSRQFIADFVERRDILADLMASKAFDLSSGELSYDKDIYDVAADVWIREPRPFRSSKPTRQEAYNEFAKIMSISEDSETGFVSISIDHISPLVAQRWLTWLIEDINMKVMADATSEAQSSIDYLAGQLEKTQIVAVQEAFFSLIEEQTKTIMLANARPEYLFKTIDPAIVPEKRAKPNRVFVVILGTTLGGLLGALAVLAQHLRRKLLPMLRNQHN